VVTTKPPVVTTKPPAKCKPGEQAHVGADGKTTCVATEFPIFCPPGMTPSGPPGAQKCVKSGPQPGPGPKPGPQPGPGVKPGKPGKPGPGPTQPGKPGPVKPAPPKIEVQCGPGMTRQVNPDGSVFCAEGGAVPGAMPPAYTKPTQPIGRVVTPTNVVIM
jgi:hypothetical protein